MKKITFTDPDTFDSKEQQFEDFHYELIDDIKEFIKEKYKCSEKISNIADYCLTDVISNKEGTELVFGIMGRRECGESSTAKYRVSVENISE